MERKKKQMKQATSSKSSHMWLHGRRAIMRLANGPTEPDNENSSLIAP